MARIWSRVSIEGERPPCKQKIWQIEIRVQRKSPRSSGGERFSAHLIVDQSSQGKVVKQVGKELPDVGIPVFPQALVVKSIDLSNLSTFVVPSENGNSITITEFQSDEKGDGLDGVVSSVDVVSHEKVVGIGRVSSNAEQFREIVLQARNGRYQSVSHGKHWRHLSRLTNCPWISPQTVTGHLTG